MKRLYNQYDGDNWNNKIGWLATEDVCFWRGLNCDRTGLSKLVLSEERSINRPIDGSILADLKNLREFDLRSANFQGQPIPNAFEDWQNLSMFRAHFNNIGGALPTFSGSKKKFWLMDIRGNQFTGSIPDNWSNLTELKFLDIAANQISGPLPEDFDQLEQLQTFFFDQDNICVPNQNVWDWLQKIPETNGRNFQRCNEVPSSITMLTPIDQTFDLETQASEVIKFDWTQSQDPENVPISYTWVLANEIQLDGQTVIAPILEIEVNNQTEVNFSRSALADSLATRGFGDQIKDFFHYAIATDGDWTVSTDTVAIELALAAQDCSIEGAISIESSECFQANSGKAEVQLRKSFGLVRYDWNTGASGAALSDLSPGNYEVVIEDQTGCQKTLYGFVPVSKLAADFNRTADIIKTTVSGGTAPYSIGWHDEVLGADRVLEQESTYSMVIMDAQGCQQLILSPPILKPISGQTSSSFVAHWESVPNASGYIIQVAKDEDFNQLLAAYEYVQLEGLDWIEITNLAESEAYFYRVAAYSSDALSEFTEPQRVQLDQENCQLFITGNSQDIVRDGNDNGSIEVFAYGGNGNYNYQWSDNASNRVRNNLFEGRYSVTVSDSDNCMANQTFEVERLDRYAIGNLVWHDRNRNGLQDPGEPGIPGVKVYMWKDDNRDGSPERGGVVETDENGLWRHEDLDPGSYLIFVWEVDNFDPGGPLFNMVNSPGSLDTNNDFPIDDNGEPGSVNNPLPFGSVASKYIVLGDGAEPLLDGDEQDNAFNKDPSGNMTVDFGFFYKDECPEMTARFSGDLLLCDEQSLGDISAVAVNAVGPVRYQWSPENQTPNLTQVGAGTYTVTITDNVGCTQTVRTEVRSLNNFELEATITNESVSGAQDGSIDLVDSLLTGLEFTWSNGSTEIDQTNLAAGDYQLIIIREEGCQAVFDYTVSLTTSTQSIYEDFGLKIVPNPSVDFIQLQRLDQTSKFGPMQGQIIDLAGKVLQRIDAQNLDGFNQQLRITSSKLSAGSYVLQLQKDNQIANQLFIISK
ncbi:MAG: SdrD B-like domain-containing protein [Bacteroidota bacterium]